MNPISPSPVLKPVNAILYALIVTNPVSATRIVHLWKTATPANVSPNKMKSTGIPNIEGSCMRESR
jgi:hypothetical protein